jgi:hypothetical protein
MTIITDKIYVKGEPVEVPYHVRDLDKHPIK